MNTNISRHTGRHAICGVFLYFSAWLLSVESAMPLTPEVNCPPPYIFTTLAGKTPSGNAGATTSPALFSHPRGVAIDAAGIVYVADTFNQTICRMTPAGDITILAGSPGVAGSADGTGGAARFRYPHGLAVDGAGNIYVADAGNHTIRRVTPAGVVTTLAGVAGHPGSADGEGRAAQFNYPCSVAVDSIGTLFVADQFNATIRKVTPDGTVSTLAGLAGVYGSADGIRDGARFDCPVGVAVDSANNVYVTDFCNNAIRKVTPAGDVTTLAGRLTSSGSADGKGTAAQFYTPCGLAVDSAQNVYVADTLNHTIRRVTPDGTVTTLAGLANHGGHVDGPGSTARFWHPGGIALDSVGNIYVADLCDGAIRKGFPASPGLSPAWRASSVSLSFKTP